MEIVSSKEDHYSLEKRFKELSTVEEERHRELMSLKREHVALQGRIEFENREANPNPNPNPNWR